MKHLTAKLMIFTFAGILMLGSCEYDYYVIPPPVPKVTSTDPAENDTSVYLNKTITASFDMEMNSSTLNGTTFIVKHGTTAVAGTVSYSGTMASFIPSGYLTANTVYSGTISTGAKSTAGVPLANDYSWTFTTGTDTTGNGNDTTIVIVDTISFSQDIIPFFTAKCLVCHKGSTPPDLRATKAYTSLINGSFVISKDPDNSILYKEIIPGGGMKSYTTSGEAALVKRWILAGIKNN